MKKDSKKQSGSSGKVYFVGAGPSDPGLLTVKGLQVLHDAQAVIYDALIGPGICSLIPQTAEKIPVGKRAGRHSVKQEEINRLILEQAQKGRTVVRLKGGDPFLFGRGGEELELLCEHGIPYEIVPGITSALAVPAYAGIPVTYRGISSSVHILTGHKKQDEPLDMDFEALVRAKGTYVCLMGMSALHEIAAGFLKAGMSADMPAAVIEQGTGARQRTVLAKLSMLEEEVKKQRLEAPAVIVIGKTVSCAEKYAWRDMLPLSGCRIVVTRPSSRSKKLTRLLQGFGAEVIEQPSVRTRLRDCASQLNEVLDGIAEYDYMVFTSPAGVDYFFDLLNQMERDIRSVGLVKLAAIGSATADALKKHGLCVELMPEQYNSEALGTLLHESVSEGGKVLLLRSAIGNRDLVKLIQGSKQITVTDLAIYDTVINQHAENDLTADMVMFTSASAVRGFVQMTKEMDHTKICAVCIGRMTADQALAYGMRVHLSEKETVESMAQAAVRLHRERNREQNGEKFAPLHNDM